jgi:hypothetical protein
MRVRNGNAVSCSYLTYGVVLGGGGSTYLAASHGERITRRGVTGPRRPANAEKPKFLPNCD